MAHPFIGLLRDRNVGFLWAGLAFSAVGSELSRIAMVWLAIEIVGASAGFLPMAQSAVVLGVSLGAGLFVDRLSRRATMIATELLSAIVAILPVLFATIYGLSFASLVMSAMSLAALSALFQPALLSTIPQIAGGQERIQATNALLDATTRFAKLAGPFVAGPLSAVLPALYFLAVNAASFLASALVLRSIGLAIGGAGRSEQAASARQRLTRGVVLMIEQPAARLILMGNSAVLAAWTVGVTLGLPFLVAETGVSGFGLAGLGALAVLMGSYGAGDFASNLWVAGRRPRRLGRFMFNGYIMLGGALALLPAPLWLLPEAARLPTMSVAAFISGFGGPIFFVPMMTFLQTRLRGADLASVIRLRLASVAAAMMLGAGLGQLLFSTLGAPSSVAIAGAVIAMVGLWGSLRRPDLDRQD